jgi:hypothetical protein
MKPYRNHVIMTLLAGVLATPCAWAGVSGQVDFHGASWAVADAMAYPDDDELKVTFTSQAIDRAAFAADGKIDIFDFMRMSGNTLSLRIDAEGKSGCIDFGSDTGGGSSCGSYDDALTLSHRDDQRIAGRFQSASGEDKIAIEFDLPVTTKVERPGQKLPADGGAPGAAARAHFAALEAGDFAKLKSISHPERRAMMEDSEQSGEAKEMFEMLRAMSPRKVRILGGSENGDSAILDFVGEEDGQEVKGTIELERHEGKWYVAGTSR